MLYERDLFPRTVSGNARWRFAGAGDGRVSALKHTAKSPLPALGALFFSPNQRREVISSALRWLRCCNYHCVLMVTTVISAPCVCMCSQGALRHYRRQPNSHPPPTRFLTTDTWLAGTLCGSTLSFAYRARNFAFTTANVLITPSFNILLNWFFISLPGWKNKN